MWNSGIANSGPKVVTRWSKDEAMQNKTLSFSIDT